MSYQEIIESYNHCEELTRRCARNFYYGIRILPETRRRSLCAFYAFTRLCDDISDRPGKSDAEKKEDFVKLRNTLDAVLNSSLSTPAEEFWPALVDTTRRYRIPVSFYYDVIKGTEQDLTTKRFQTYDDLSQYCYYVAGAVGIVTIIILGVKDKTAFESARTLGRAFQMTNILRDIREDFETGRNYIPETDLNKFQYTGEDIKNKTINKSFYELIKYEVDRTESLYREGEKVLDFIPGYLSRVCVSTMAGIYKSILIKIKAAPENIYSRRVSLNCVEKYLILFKKIISAGARRTK